MANAKPEDVGHINAHATSTPVGDIAEYSALLRVFGDHLKSIPVSATKSSTGHLLGGAGAIEAIFTVLAVYEKTAPPTLNLENQDQNQYDSLYQYHTLKKGYNPYHEYLEIISLQEH
mgnify:CR=1 FL=1